MLERLVSLLGLGAFIGFAYLLSVNRRGIQWRPVLWGVALQLLFALLILRTPVGLSVFKGLGDAVSRFLEFSDAGAAFVFGENFQDFFIAFKILPTIVFFSAVISLLYHYGVLQRAVQGMAWLMMRTLKTSGAESLSAASNIFVGPTEAPLLIKPYVGAMTLSELHAIMVGGFATVAGGVLAAYISFGVPAEHLIAASVMSAPAGLAISKVMYPETEVAKTAGKVTVAIERTAANAIDAVTIGTLDGLRLALNVGAMLLVFTALLAAVNGLIGWCGSWFGQPTLSLELLLGYLMAPVAWLMGVPLADCLSVGALLGKKTILNEFLAYLDLQALVTATETTGSGISERAALISTYALCGFSNLATIGIQVGGLGGMAPNRQPDFARLGVRTMIGGSLACFMTATVAGFLL
jgi:CNT family concentrative nucleoside transporter